MNSPIQKIPAPLDWWVIWVAILSALVVVYLLEPYRATRSEVAIRYFPVLPLFLSAVFRWLLLPRFSDGKRAFPIFVVGAALAEGAAILGMLLVPDLKFEYFLLGLAGIVQFVPLFLSRFHTQPHEEADCSDTAR